jgi:hypothetical protein
LLCIRTRLSAIHRTEQRSGLASLCVSLNSAHETASVWATAVRCERTLHNVHLQSLYCRHVLLPLHIVRDRHTPRTMLWKLSRLVIPKARVTGLSVHCLNSGFSVAFVTAPTYAEFWGAREQTVRTHGISQATQRPAHWVQSDIRGSAGLWD